jgi:hypothetical protein
MRTTLVTATAIAIALLAGTTGHAVGPVIDVGPLVEPSLLPVAATGHAHVAPDAHVTHTSHVAPDVIVIRYTYNGITDISPPTRLDVFYDVAPDRPHADDCANMGGTYNATSNTCQKVDY